MIFVEPCSGGAAVSLRLMGQRPLTPYLGGKAQFADAIIAALGIGCEPLDSIVLGDAGPWGTVWQTLATNGAWDAVARKVEQLGQIDVGRGLFDEIANAAPPDADTRAVNFTASFLILQSAAARGRPVYPNGDRWMTPGYAHLSASGRAKGFKERLRPDLLAKRIRAMGAALARPGRPFISGRCEFIETCADHVRRQARRVVVYIDPQYQGTTGYQHSVPPETLRAVAEQWRSDGALVAVSEGVPLPWDGWHHVRLSRRGGGTRLGRVSEWLTLSLPPMGQLGLEG